VSAPGGPEGPDRLFFDLERPRRDHKLPQMCKQIERAANEVLMGEMADEVWTGACVAAVEPAPDASRLAVIVVLPAGTGDEQVVRAEAALRRAAPAFRRAAAAAIHRKRTPELAFRVLVAGGGA
jgi:ribosome-binding factor A